MAAMTEKRSAHGGRHLAEVPARPKPRARLIVRHRLIGEALRSLLQEAGQVEVGPVETLGPDVDPARILDTEVVVLDVARFGGAEREVVEHLGVYGVRPPVVLLVDEVDATTALRAMDCGVEGILDRAATAAALVMAIQQVLAGQSVFPAGVLAARGARRAPEGLATLSLRQREVLRLLAEGRSNEAIGRELFISVNTVKFHVREIFRKLGLHNRVQASQRYAELRAGAA